MLFAGMVFIAAQAEAVCSHSVRLAGDDVAYLYAGAFIDSLSYADQANKRMAVGLGSLRKAPPTQSDVYSAFVDALTALELAAKDLECAASLIAPQKRMPAERTTELGQEMAATARQSAALTEREYLNLAKLMREYSGIMQAGSPGTTERAGKVAALLAKMQESWGYVVHAVLPTEMLLVDPEPDAAGHLSRLRITEQQRRDLLKSIDQTFGSRAQRKADDNTPAAEVAAIQLREFLTKKGYTLRK